MRAHARIVAEIAGKVTRLREISTQAPFAVRETDEGVFLVGSAQGLIGDDELDLELVLHTGAHLRIRSAAAAIAYASTAARIRVSARIGRSALLDWHPEPLIATSSCRLKVVASIDVERGGALDWTEECILGRVNEEPGELNLALSVNYADCPALRHELVIGKDLNGWDGPAVLGESRVVGFRAVIDDRNSQTVGTTPALNGSRWALLPLESHGCVITAVGTDLIDLRSAMETARDRLRPLPI